MREAFEAEEIFGGKTKKFCGVLVKFDVCGSK